MPLRQPAAALVQAHISYQWQGAHAETRLPIITSPAIVHAAAVTTPAPTSPWFQDRPGKLWRWQALCGATIRVLLPAFFDDQAPRSCQACATEMEWLFAGEAEIPLGALIYSPGRR